MRKLFIPLMAVMLMAGTTETLLAVTGPHKSTKSTKSVVKKRVPNTGYPYGYAAGKRFVTSNTSSQQFLVTWRDAKCNLAYYSSQGQDDFAEYWQGYVDALGYVDDDGWEQYCH